MKHCTIRTPDGGTSAARVDGDELIVLDADDVGDLLRRRAAGSDAREVERRSFDGVELAPVVVNPSKIFCVGHNYVSHIEEMGRDLPSHPTLFAKFARALTGPHDDIVLPANSEAMDWEAELTIVVGDEVRGVGDAEARAAIAGFTVANDISARDWQFRTLQWLQGKTLEASTPVGPVMVDAADVDGAADLAVTCSVDGEVMQNARTSDLLFDPATLVAYISQIITLEPGDLVLTGTTSGVGHGREPKRYLRPGEVVTTEIEGIGRLTNTCIAP